jgi:mono/diheme cytochrome c family protein
MNLSLETKALGWAVLVALLSLGGAFLAAIPIKIMTGSGAAATGMSSAGSSSEIVATPELVAQGHEFFETSCSECHGDDATGDEGPNLHNLSISNARIAHTIKNGIKGEMPTFAKKYDDRQITALVSYLRSLQ